MGRLKRTAAGLIAVSMLVTGARASDLPSHILGHLEKDEYVYIASTRKSGELGTAAEIWFWWDGSDVFVGTNVGSYRVRRIKAGRPAARIWVKDTDGPWFAATGALVDGRDAQDRMIETYSEKYGDSFTKSWKAKFRAGFDAGTTVVVRYTPTGPTGAGPEGLPPEKD